MPAPLPSLPPRRCMWSRLLSAFSFFLIFFYPVTSVANVHVYYAIEHIRRFCSSHLSRAVPSDHRVQQRHIQQSVYWTACLLLKSRAGTPFPIFYILALLTKTKQDELLQAFYFLHPPRFSNRPSRWSVSMCTGHRGTTREKTSKPLRSRLPGGKQTLLTKWLKSEGEYVCCTMNIVLVSRGKLYFQVRIKQIPGISSLFFFISFFKIKQSNQSCVASLPLVCCLYDWFIVSWCLGAWSMMWCTMWCATWCTTWSVISCMKWCIMPWYHLRWDLYCSILCDLWFDLWFDLIFDLLCNPPVASRPPLRRSVFPCL